MVEGLEFAVVKRLAQEYLRGHRLDIFLLYYYGSRTEATNVVLTLETIGRRVVRTNEKPLSKSTVHDNLTAANKLLQPMLDAMRREALTVTRYAAPEESPPRFDVTLQFGHDADTREDITAATACDPKRLKKFYQKAG